MSSILTFTTNGLWELRVRMRPRVSAQGERVAAYVDDQKKFAPDRRKPCRGTPLHRESSRCPPKGVSTIGNTNGQNDKLFVPDCVYTTHWCCQPSSGAEMRSDPAVFELDGRMTMSISQPSAIRRRRRRASEYSPKSPRSRRDRSGRDRPSARAASAWVVRRCRMMSSIRLTSSAFSRCVSASGRSRSANTLPLPRSTEHSEAFIVHVPVMPVPVAPPDKPSRPGPGWSEGLDTANARMRTIARRRIRAIDVGGTAAPVARPNPTM